MPETVHSQYRWRRGREFIEPERDIFPGNGFTFCRLRYNSNPGGWRGRGGSWLTDYPDSDLNFSQRLSELTTIQVNRSAGGAIQHAIVGLMEADLFNYPFLYTLEVEGLYFSEAESKRLRSYLLRGGFLMVDDFWGSNAWANFEYEIGKALPPEDYPIVDIPLDHEIFHIVFQVNEVPQIPGIDWWYRTGMTAEPREGSQEPHCRGIFDKKGRLMVVILHNTDLGDGWEEEARNPIYFREFSARKAYPLGINIVVYAMTH
ncbi:MAG: DUF4159 domain-containing protein [Candidatus Omnitrophica bacterium]|nr:DUF4159 domain-containing protein [Candidatus Omnitrophota bacterium]